MDDLISRQAAIDNLERYRELFSWDDGDRERAILSRVIKELQSMPTAEKRGEWIPVVDGNYIVWECSECHVESDAWTDYCPICGSRNIEEMDEEAFEEALEEFRKNPKTCTLDEVEAELGLTAEPNYEEAFEAGYTKAQMELKDAYKPRNGKWVKDEEQYHVEMTWHCDQCGAEAWGCEELTPYCPNCGARMEE